MDLQTDTAPAAAPSHDPEPRGTGAAQTLVFSFTGSGHEYFRIWVVNLLLTLATLGIYSAWAKVRRLQYFDRNTHLAGASFDFRGDPAAILKGRVLAVLLLAAYNYAFGFSLEVGLAVIAVLLLALPFLIRGALRFRLANTQYRGLSFGFNGSVRGAYRAYLPPIATFLLPAALVAAFPDGTLAALATLLYLGWPAMHGAMKRYQHRHILYGDQQSAYEVPARRFYRPYLRGGLLALAALVACTALATGAVLALSRIPGPRAATWLPLALGGVFGYLFYLLAGPYMQVRIANLAWSNTSFPGIRIRSTLSARQFVRLQTANAVLTLLTLGLYRPFAVVRVYRYRLAHLALEADADVDQVAARTERSRASAAGDGAADFLGVDISW
ncbi:MAG: YjgN family protein [Massilia sp.]